MGTNHIKSDETEMIEKLDRIATAIERIARALDGDSLRDPPYRTRSVAQSLDEIADCTSQGDSARSFSVNGD